MLVYFDTSISILEYPQLQRFSKIQEVICNVISGIPGAKNFSDDIIIYGKSQIEHDRELDNIVKRLLENGLALNLE